MKIHDNLYAYIEEEYLSNKTKGEYLYLIINENFFNTAARRLKTDSEKIISDIKSLYDQKSNKSLSDQAIVAMVVLQLYAASKCENDEEHTDVAYRPRLTKLLSYTPNVMTHWLTNNQDNLWNRFYNWCRLHDYKVFECPDKKRAGRYVQYPLSLAKYTLNQTDLEHLGTVYIENGLSPNNSFTPEDFWQFFSISEFSLQTNHLKKIINEGAYHKLIKAQILNHFNTWNGEYYFEKSHNFHYYDYAKQHYIFLTIQEHDVRVFFVNNNDRILDEILIGTNSHQDLYNKSHYKKKKTEKKKYKNIIFQKHQCYDDYWEEVPFIENQKEKGILIVFNDSNVFLGKLIKMYKNIFIYEIEYGEKTKQYYTQSTPIYELVGGLSINRNTYLLGGSPTFKLNKDTTLWINGEKNNFQKGLYNLDKLGLGEHYIKIPEYKPIKINILQPSSKEIEWKDSFSKWKLDKEDTFWEPVSHSDGFIGLDFSKYSVFDDGKSNLFKWREALNGAKTKTTDNLTLKLLNNINNHD